MRLQENSNTYLWWEYNYKHEKKIQIQICTAIVENSMKQYGKQKKKTNPENRMTQHMIMVHITEALVNSCLLIHYEQ